MQAHAPPTGSAPAIRRIAAAALAVAALDFLYVTVVFAVILKRTTLERLAQSIATGVLGKAAFEGGAGTVVLGLVLHLFIAFCWTLIFYVASRRIGWLRGWVSTRTGRIRTGLLYGPVIWLAMDLVVLPLSRAGAVPVTRPFFYIHLVQHALMIGLPMVLILGAPAPYQNRFQRSS